MRPSINESTQSAFSSDHPENLCSCAELFVLLEHICSFLRLSSLYSPCHGICYSQMHPVVADGLSPNFRKTSSVLMMSSRKRAQGPASYSAGAEESLKYVIPSIGSPSFS